MTKKERVGTNFETSIGSRSDFRNIQIGYRPDDRGTINCFTDGSKTNEGAGAGYMIRAFDWEKGQSHSVDISNSVFQTEVLAINDAADYLIERGVEDKNIYFYVDNQAAIRALGKYTISSKLVRDTKIKVNKLSEKNKVEIKWVPGHSRIRGNMIADGKARIGSSNPNNRVRTKLPVNKAFYKKAIKDWGRREHQKRWNRRTTCRQTAMFLPKVDNKAWKVVRKMNRRNAMYATQIITGHCSLQRHLSLMFAEEPPECPKCGLEPETVEHVVKFCPAYMHDRIKVLGEYFLSGEISNYELSKVLKFVSSIKRLSFEMG